MPLGKACVAMDQLFSVQDQVRLVALHWQLKAALVLKVSERAQEEAKVGRVLCWWYAASNMHTVFYCLYGES